MLELPKRTALVVTAAWLCAGFAAWLSAGVAHAGTYVVAETKLLDRQPARTEQAQVWLDTSRIRVDMAGTNTLLFDSGKETAWLLDHHEKTVFQVDRGTAQAVGNTMASVNNALRESLEGLPPEQRAAMEQMLGGRMPAEVPAAAADAASSVEIKPTGETSVVSGVSCAEHEAIESGKRVALVCIADFGAAGVTRESFAVLGELASFAKDSVGAMLPAGIEVPDEGLAALDSLSALEGVPMRMRAFDEGKLVSETVVQQIGTKDTAASQFAVPAGYQGGITIPNLDALRGKK